MTPERALVERVASAFACTCDTGLIYVHESLCRISKIAAFAAEYAREQVEQAVVRAPSTGQIDLHAMYNHARAEAAAARQREEEAKERLAQCEASWHRLDAACRVRFEELRAENDRLTLAASESARTLQVRIAELEAGERHCDEYHGELADQVTALREAIGKGMNAPSGTPICLCHNHNAVLSQRERPCWYCEVRAVLAEQGWASFHASEETAARVILERNRYQMALQSIAANTCCDRCHEAALVAAAALAALPQDGA